LPRAAGEEVYAEKPGDIDDLELPRGLRDFAAATIEVRAARHTPAWPGGSKQVATGQSAGRALN
jgi:hypothetical protein